MKGAVATPMASRASPSWWLLSLFLLLITTPAHGLRISCTRANAVQIAAAAALFPHSAARAADAEAAAATMALLKEARSQLEPCAQQIADGNWDGVRNVVKTAPLANTKNLVTKYIGEAGEMAEDLVIPREDFVNAAAQLDMAVYNNVFIGEQNGQGAPGKGVKIDRDTPMRYLGETKAALDEIIAFKP